MLATHQAKEMRGFWPLGDGFTVDIEKCLVGVISKDDLIPLALFQRNGSITDKD